MSISATHTPFTATWCQTAEEIAEAQRLRYQIFALEMGAKLPGARDGRDIDEFDAYCQHLIIRAGEQGQVVGTYRVLTPEAAKQIGRIYTEGEFDLAAFAHLRPKMIEVGRSCVHPDFRSGSSIMALWSGLGQFMQAHGYDALLGCASVSIEDGGQYAWSLYRQFAADGTLSQEFNAPPRQTLEMAGLDVKALPQVKPPPLLKGYLRLGAKVCGLPAIDPDFNTADFLTLLQLSEINPRYARHFLGSR